MRKFAYRDRRMHMGIPVCIRAGIAKIFAYGDPITHNEVVRIWGLTHILWVASSVKVSSCYYEIWERSIIGMHTSMIFLNVSCMQYWHRIRVTRDVSLNWIFVKSPFLDGFVFMIMFDNNIVSLFFFVGYCRDYCWRQRKHDFLRFYLKKDFNSK